MIRNTSTSENNRTLPIIKSELDYEKRLKQLESQGKALQIDDNDSIMHYYECSAFMIKKADSQYSNNDLENALLSYLKFLDLFRKKITKHANFKRVPLSTKCLNQFYQRHAQNRVKDLRQKLLKQYKEMVLVHQGENESKAAKKLPRHCRTVSRVDLKSLTSVHTIAMDSSALDIEACRSLRTVVVPKQLPTIFQITAQKKFELAFIIWGALAGQFVNNEYVVTHLIIPQKQDMDVSDLNLDPIECYAEKHQLVILGWIHIHRYASCFLSSMDLHAQWKCQRRLPEAIGIVCAPNWTQVETYMLLKHGLDFIGEYTQKGMHTHSSSKPLYTIARHVKVVYHLQFELVYLGEAR